MVQIKGRRIVTTSESLTNPAKDVSLDKATGHTIVLSRRETWVAMWEESRTGVLSSRARQWAWWWVRLVVHPLSPLSLSLFSNALPTMCPHTCWAPWAPTVLTPGWSWGPDSPPTGKKKCQYTLLVWVWRNGLCLCVSENQYWHHILEGSL